MIRKIISCVLVLIALISCSDKSGKAAENEVVSVKEDPLVVTLNAIVKEDDTLQVYYRFDPTTDFLAEQVVTSVVKGSENPQNVVFNVPTDDPLADFRIDFGTNKSQKEIEIKDFKMQYKGKAFNAKDTLFYQYFWNNESIEYNREKAVAKPVIKGTNYDPIFMPREVLMTEIQKILVVEPNVIK